jgi:hypothetical protein
MGETGTRLKAAIRATLLLVGGYVAALVAMVVVAGVVMVALQPHACAEFSRALIALWWSLGAALVACWCAMALIAWMCLTSLLARGAVLALYGLALLATYVVIAFGLMVAFNC